MLQTKNLSKIYKSESSFITALSNVSVSFEKGKIYGIVGHNGAGKTTLIKLLCGLVFPTSGGVYLDGYALYPDNFKLLYKIGAILEGSRNIFWNLTPLQNIKYFALLRGLSFNRVLRKASHYLELFELTDKINTPVRTLSQGMKQKIAIIISLLHDPEILLLDEPTLGLDPASSSGMQALIRDVASKENKTVIITSHQLNIIERLSDILIFLSKGTVKYFGKTNDFVSQQAKQRYILTVSSNKKDLTEYLGNKVIGIQENNDKLMIRLEIPENELNAILTYLVGNNIFVFDVEKESVTLEDVFLRASK